MILFIIWLVPIAILFIVSFRILKNIFPTEQKELSEIAFRIFGGLFLVVFATVLLIFDFVFCFKGPETLHPFISAVGILILGLFWMLIFALAMGLGKAVGAGSSSTSEVFKDMMKNLGLSPKERKN